LPIGPVFRDLSYANDITRIHVERELRAALDSRAIANARPRGRTSDGSATNAHHQAESMRDERGEGDDAALAERGLHHGRSGMLPRCAPRRRTIGEMKIVMHSLPVETIALARCPMHGRADVP
jgi:hypothetical protein